MNTLFAKSGPEWTTLSTHLLQVAAAAKEFSRYLNMDEKIAFNGAIMHDIGKAHPLFQAKLKGKKNSFRHEIASLFFLSVFPENQWDSIIEMVAGHHKSVKKDISELGLLDLEENDDYIEEYIGDWNSWSIDAFTTLSQLGGFQVEKFDSAQASRNLEYCINYCREESKVRGYSSWRGLLMGADHFASSMIDKTESQLKRLFKNPDLSFYERQHPLYPLSYKNVSSNQKQNIVVASTGAGKTDFLFKRCKGRVFYTLPFQASINAMYNRVSNELELQKPNMDIRLQHST